MACSLIRRIQSAPAYPADKGEVPYRVLALLVGLRVKRVMTEKQAKMADADHQGRDGAPAGSLLLRMTASAGTVVSGVACGLRGMVCACTRSVPDVLGQLQDGSWPWPQGRKLRPHRPARPPS